MKTETLIPVWAIGSVDADRVFEVCPVGGKFVVVQARVNGGRTERTVDSKRGMQLERAKARATWLAGKG